MDGVGDALEPGPPSRPPPSSNDGRRLAFIWLGGLIAVLLIVLIIILLLTEDDRSSVAADTTSTEAAPTSEPTTTSAPGTTTTTSATTTTTSATTTTALATTTTSGTTTTTSGTTTTTSGTTTTTSGTTTTTSVPLLEDTGTKNCPGLFPQVARVTEITFGKLEDFTRVIFYFEGAPAPGCEVGYISDPRELRVTVFAVSVLNNPFLPGIFDGGGYVAIGLGSVFGVDFGGPGGGSGEWSFVVGTTGMKGFVISAVSGPSRLIIDIAD